MDAKNHLRTFYSHARIVIICIEHNSNALLQYIGAFFLETSVPLLLCVQGYNCD